MFPQCLQGSRAGKQVCSSSFPDPPLIPFSVSFHHDLNLLKTFPMPITGHLAATVCEGGRNFGPGYLLWGLAAGTTLRIARSFQFLNPWDPQSLRHPELGPDSLFTPVDYSIGTGVMYDDSGFAVFPPWAYPQRVSPSRPPSQGDGGEEEEEKDADEDDGRSPADDPGRMGVLDLVLFLYVKVAALIIDTVSPWSAAAPGIAAGHARGHFSVAGILNLLSCVFGALAGALLCDSVMLLSYSVFQTRILKVRLRPIAETLATEFDDRDQQGRRQRQTGVRHLRPGPNGKAQQQQQAPKQRKANSNLLRNQRSRTSQRSTRPSQLLYSVVVSFFALLCSPVLAVLPEGIRKPLWETSRTLVRKLELNEKVWRPLESRILGPVTEYTDTCVDWLWKAPFLSTLLSLPNQVIVFDVNQLRTPYFRAHQSLCLWSAAIAGAWAGLGFGLQGSVWSRSIVGDPWALNNLMVVVVLWFLVIAFRPMHRYARAGPSRRLLGGLGFTVGVAVCNQPTILLCEWIHQFMLLCPFCFRLLFHCSWMIM